MRSTFLVICAVLTAACSSSSGDDTSADSGAEASTDASDGSTPHDAATADGSPADSSPGDGGTACNAIANVAQTITIQQVASAPPAAQGGTFVDGTYAMTDFTIFTGAGGATGPSGTTQTTLQISGDTFQVVSASTPATRTVSVVVSGSSVTATDTCPDSMLFQETFTATATSFVVYIGDGSTDAGARTIAETFTKQ